ncbi:MAG: MarR family transcriptional regulator [Candidatus Izemoplasma sp.]
MEGQKKVINDLLVEVFNHILSIEGMNLKRKGVKLSMNEIHVLEAIVKTSTPTMTNISKRLRITVGTLTTAINRLVEKGFCTRYSDSLDKRKVYIKNTQTAIDVLKIHDEFHDEMVDALFEDMNLHEDKLLLNSLENLNEYFKQKY